MDGPTGAWSGVTLVIDASTVVAGLVAIGDVGEWAEAQLARSDLIAPHHLLVEVANVLRRAELSGSISRDVAVLAHADLGDLSVGLVPYRSLADRVWELRNNVTAYDACYVAVAEEANAALATLDHRLIKSSGPCCEFITAPI